jgi:RHS repeat-associated protein
VRSHFITQQQRTLPAPTETRGYGYQDWQYYLTCGSGPWGGTACSPSPTGNPLQWTYDKIGNRATEVRAGLTDSYVYDDNSGATGDTAVLDVVNLGVLGTRDYTFDNGGYLSQIAAGANVLDFTFDAAGELGSVVRGAQSLTNSYDGRGFLQSAADATSGGSVNATYSSSGLLHSLERLPATGGTLERHNVLYFSGRPIAIWKKVGAAAATTTYLVTDHLGTPAYALNQAGTEYWKGGLEPFGRDWQEGTANDMLTKGIFLRFPGQWDDALFTSATLGADAYYNVYRWMEPSTGRYFSPDPIGLKGSPNLFEYANGRPFVFTDPDGRLVTWALAQAGCASVFYLQARFLWLDPFGDGYAHCRASCEIATWCGVSTATAAGIAKELSDVVKCQYFGQGGNCQSAFEPRDLANNARGIGCRPDCEKSCAPLKVSK